MSWLLERILIRDQSWEIRHLGIWELTPQRLRKPPEGRVTEIGIEANAEVKINVKVDALEKAKARMLSHLSA